jgi:activator of HSP90 ATPase
MLNASCFLCIQFKTNVTSVTGSDASAGIEVVVTSVKTIEGDVTVGQRKSKCVPLDSSQAFQLLCRTIDCEPEEALPKLQS